MVGEDVCDDWSEELGGEVDGGLWPQDQDLIVEGHLCCFGRQDYQRTLAVWTRFIQE